MRWYNMPRDITREEASRDWTTSVIEFGEEAASVGIGAASLYRIAKGHNVASAIHKYARYASTINKAIKSRSYDDWNKKEIKSVYKEVKSEFSKIRSDIAANPLKGNIYHPRSLFEPFSSAVKFFHERDAKRIATNELYNRNVRNQLMAFTRKQMEDAQNSGLYSGNPERAKQEADYLTELLLKSYEQGDNGYVQNKFAYSHAATRFEEKLRKTFYGTKEEVSRATWSIVQNANDELQRLLSNHYGYMKNRPHDSLPKIEEQLFDIIMNPQRLLKGNHGKKSFVHKAIDNLLGDRQVTLGELIDKYGDPASRPNNVTGFTIMGKKSNGPGYEHIDVLEKLKELADKEPKIRRLTVDPYLRTDGNRIYSFDEFASIKDRIWDIAAGSLPGQLFKLRDVHEVMKSPSIIQLSEGSLNPIIATLTNNRAANGDKYLDSNYFYIMGDVYRQETNTDNFVKIEELSGKVNVFSGRLGLISRLTSSMTGSNAERYRDSSEGIKNWLMNYFDIANTTEVTILDNIKSVLWGREDGRKNMENRFNNWMTGNPFLTNAVPQAHMTQNIPFGSALETAEVQEYRTIHKMMDFFNDNTFALNNEAVRKLLENEQDGRGRTILQLLDMPNGSFDNMNLLEILNGDYLAAGNNVSPFMSLGLDKLLSSFNRDQQTIARRLKLKNDQSGAYYQGKSVAQDIEDLVRTELSKEYFLLKASEQGGDPYTIAKSLIDNAGMSMETSRKTKELAYYAILDDSTSVFSDKYPNGTWDQVEQGIGRFTQLFKGQGRTEAQEDAALYLHNIFTNHSSIFDAEKIKLESDTLPKNSPDYLMIKKGIGVIDLIKGLNDAIYESGAKRDAGKDVVEGFFKQWTAGRGNLEDVTTYTYIPYFFLHRLGDGLDYVGLGFSNKSTGSVLDMAATITKRGLALGVGYTALEWGDDTVGAITGIRASAIGVNAFANVDLGLRKIADTFGISGAIDSAMDFAPLSYWSDGNTFNNYEEEKKYYEDGYEPIRKGRYWMFGSANEFRGGQIEYFRPNLTRRLNSDYYNKSLYDGYWNKWMHSLVPTPAMPLSPLIYMLDPYYLERDHYDDRPYPISAPMFAEGTPWGTILNPTIGELIKPKIRMHQDRMYGGMDVLSLIADVNADIRRKAMDADEQNVFVLDNGRLTPSNYYDYDHPTPTETVVTNYNTRNLLDQDGEYNPNITFGRMQEGIPISLYGDAIESSGGYVTGSSIGGGNGRTWGGGFTGGGQGGKLYGTSGTHGGPLQYHQENVIAHAILHPIESLSNIPGKAIDIVLPPILSVSKGLNFISETANHPGDAMYSVATSAIDAIEGMASSTASDVATTGRAISGTIEGDNSSVNYNRALDIIAHANDKIYQRAMSGKNGVFIGDKIAFNISPVHEMLSRDDEVKELMQAGSGNELIKQMETSARLIGGIYGYGANRLFGLGDFTDPHIANAGSMDSFARSFWDASIGGLGGEASEIGRRFVPELRRRTEVNPLINTMPDWLPERFRIGDPYAGKVPYGEARLPGKGYEALNELHSDEYGYYGAFDRYKILADIAPFSEEFKLWKKIARNKISNPELLKEMEEIQERVDKQSKAHDFYDYKFIGKSAEYQSAIVTKIMENGEFMINGSDKIYKLAGVQFSSFEKHSEEILGSILAPGSVVQLGIDSNEYHREDSAGRINAAVFLDGESVSQMLYDERLVKKKKGTNDAADVVAMHGGTGRLLGSIAELVGHLEIPLISSRWLRIQSPMESYKSEQIMGDAYQSWDDVIGTTILPSFYKSIGGGPFDAIKETAAFMMASSKQVQMLEPLKFGNTRGLTKAMMYSGLMSAVNRDAFMGGAMAYFFFPNKGDYFAKGQKIGAAVELIGNMYSSVHDSYLGSAANWGLAGYFVGDILDDKSNKPTIKANGEAALESLKNSGASEIEQDWQKAKNILNEFFRGKDSMKFRGKYIAGMAAIGMGLHAMIGSVLSDNDHWIPETTKQKWEIEEYFDRLSYIKYSGLYHRAASKALSEEGVDVEGITNTLDNATREAASIRETLKSLMSAAQSHNLSNIFENQYIIEQNNRLNSLRSTQLILKGGEYTRSALLYKQAMESTMYGLQDTATWQDIMKALPKYERDYFAEFMKEKDPDEREKILREASPFMRRALRQVWNMEYDKGESNENYFQHNNLPGVFSDVWNPNIDMNDVKAKVIKNEAMIPSQFGIYESQYQEAETINAPNISRKGDQSYLEVKMQLESILNGFGLIGVDVSVSPSATSGVQSIINISKIASYNLGEMIKEAI